MEELTFQQKLLTDKDVLLKHYERSVDVYKYFFELVLKLDSAYFLAVGALGSFYLLHKDIKDLQAIVQLLCMAGILLGQIFIYLTRSMCHLEREILVYKGLCNPIENSEIFNFGHAVCIFSYVLVTSCTLGIGYYVAGISGFWIYMASILFVGITTIYSWIKSKVPNTIIDEAVS